MKIITFVFFSALAFGQSQSGSVAIADSVVPATENVVDNFTTCVKELVAIKIAPEKATSSCKEATKIVEKIATRGFNEAADATKASRPIVITDGWGGGWGGRGYYGGGYYNGYNPPVVISSRAEREHSLDQQRAERERTLEQKRSDAKLSLADRRARAEADLERRREEAITSLQKVRSERTKKY